MTVVTMSSQNWPDVTREVDTHGRFGLGRRGQIRPETTCQQKTGHPTPSECSSSGDEKFHHKKSQRERGGLAIENSRHPAADGRRWKQQYLAGSDMPNFLIISVSCRVEYHPDLHEPTVAKAQDARSGCSALPSKNHVGLAFLPLGIPRQILRLAHLTRMELLDDSKQPEPEHG